MKNNRALDMRIWVKSYNLNCPGAELPENFECASVYYVGIRIRNGIEINRKNMDLTQVRAKFFDQLRKDIQDNQDVLDLIQQGRVDIRINYL